MLILRGGGSIKSTFPNFCCCIASVIVPVFNDELLSIYSFLSISLPSSLPLLPIHHHRCRQPARHTIHLKMSQHEPTRHPRQRPRNLPPHYNEEQLGNSALFPHTPLS